MAQEGKKIKVTLVKSVIGTKPEHRACVRGLGLRRMNHTVEVIDTPSNRGMINKVSYLLKYEG
ncbi:MAG: ribosomal protein [Betaproteobacteria bacterium]|jgi:large subunit ribosomal protein L30|nr:ribosomal protein [Betaproteobacteria bacterium]MEA3157965.1 large subunit ribosomal protein [Betaproteobacteria bacterium]